jgi:DNA primase
MPTRRVRLTNPDRVLFPEDGTTKSDLFQYYDAVAPVLVPHLRDRPFTMKRYREGIAGEGFFQKQAPTGMPAWIATRQFRTFPREGGSRLVDFPLVNSCEALLWMVQMHCIDMNAWYSRVDKPHRPDFVVFDLDPPEGGFALAVRDRQNGWGRTIASVYSVRPRPGAPVSTPIHWEELTDDVTPRQFGMQEVLRGSSVTVTSTSRCCAGGRRSARLSGSCSERGRYRLWPERPRARDRAAGRGVSTSACTRSRSERVELPEQSRCSRGVRIPDRDEEWPTAETRLGGFQLDLGDRQPTNRRPTD